MNPEQRIAAQHLEGPLLVLAGPGTGKTTTLVGRYEFLLSQNINPKQIICCTFSKKAADELKERIASNSGLNATGLPIATFHALSLRILKSIGEAIGVPRDFDIWTKNFERERVVRELQKSVIQAGLYKDVADEEKDLWDSVRARLAENASRPKGCVSTKLQQYPLVGKIFSSVGYRLAPTTVHKKETRYRHYTVNRTRHEPPYGELTSLPAHVAERVTAQALKELLSELEPQQSSLPTEVFLHTRAEVSALPLHELIGTVILHRDRLDVTLAEVCTAKLGLSKQPSYSQPIAPRSVGKRNRLILTSDPQPRPNKELILAVAAAWDWYRKLTKGQVSSLGELAAQEEITQGTITRNLPLALLKPAQVDRLLKGNHNPDLTIKMLLSDSAIL